MIDFRRGGTVWKIAVEYCDGDIAASQRRKTPVNQKLPRSRDSFPSVSEERIAGVLNFAHQVRFRVDDLVVPTQLLQHVQVLLVIAAGKLV
jgi:hypothetical protein